MVQQLFNKIEQLDKEIRRLRGRMDRISSGGVIISSGGNPTIPSALLGALLRGNSTPGWERLVAPSPATNEHDVVRFDNGDTVPSWKSDIHASRHSKGAFDEVEIDDLATDLTDTTLFYRPDGSGGITASAPSGSGAPASAQYVTLALDGGLSAERVLTAGDGISLTDGGANGNVTVAAKFSGARAYNSGNISINDSTVTAITFDSERFDVGSYHSIASATSKFTAPVAGYYLCGGCIEFASNATGSRAIGMRLNGGTLYDAVFIRANNIPDLTRLECSTIIQLAANDYVELVVFQNSGGNLNVNNVSNISPEAYITLLGI